MKFCQGKAWSPGDHPLTSFVKRSFGNFTLKALLLLFLAVPFRAPAESPSVWNGGGANDFWNNAANWGGNGPVPGLEYDLRFGGVTRLAPVNNFVAACNFRHLTFDASAGAFALTGNSITLNGNITNNSGNQQAINLPVLLGGTGVRVVSALAGNILWNSPITGNGGLQLAGRGSVTLGARSDFTNSLYINGGILNLPASGAISKEDGFVIIGQNAGQNGGLNITGGALTNTQPSNAGNFIVGRQGFGSLNLFDGIIKVNQLYIGWTGGLGTAFIDGGSVYCGTGDDYAVIGYSTGRGVLTVKSGLFQHAGARRAISLNNNGLGRAELNVLGGVLDNTGGVVGFGLNATTGSGNGTGIVNLNGGTLILNRFVGVSKNAGALPGSSYLNFNGGLLKTSPNNLEVTPAPTLSAYLIPALTAVYVNGAFGPFAGGAVIDSDGQDCVVEASLLAPTGSGIIALEVSDGGAGYVGTPCVTINGNGTGATAIANMADDGSGRGTLKVVSVTVCNPGVNYTYASFFLSGGAPTKYASPGRVTLAANSSGGLTKNGAGSLTLLGRNTYTGPTLINDGLLRVNGALDAGGAVTVFGALGGNGVIRGWVNVQPGGTLSPEGTLSISNMLSLCPGSTTFARVNAQTDESELVQGITTVHYGGTLIVTNAAGGLYQGQTFQVFRAGAHTGNFTDIQSADGGAAWAFNPATGQLTVRSLASTLLTNISIVLKENHLTLAWPASHLGWLAQSNTVDVADPAQWYNIPGSELLSNLNIPINPAREKVFYRLRTSRFYEISKHYDEESNTYYYLTRIFHKDKDGKLIKLRHALSNKPEGETVRNFALRMNTALAFNASMGMDGLEPNVRQPVGIQIVDGTIIQDLTRRTYTLGIRDDNQLLAYRPETRAQSILDDGVNDALTAFIPLIENHEPVSEELFKVAGNLVVKHPRQVIAQFDNLDILFLSCGGRGFDGDGMTADDLIRVLKKLDVRFAFSLDGGGSVSVVAGNKLITKKIDSNGTEERLRPNFLYVLEN